MEKRIKRILLGVLAGLLVLVALVWVFTKTLGNAKFPSLYAGKTMEYWQHELYGRDAGASNVAYARVSADVIPPLVATMFSDTNDSSLRLLLINTLNGLPGVQITYIEAGSRRADAASALGELGPAANSAVPDLIRALKRNEAAICPAILSALGRIHGEPDTVIPLLIPYLDDDNFDVAAAGALGQFGSLAKPAVPKLVPLLQAKDDDDREAARAALKKIDPIAEAKAEDELRKKAVDISTNHPEAGKGN